MRKREKIVLSATECLIQVKQNVITIVIVKSNERERENRSDNIRRVAR